MPRKKKKAGREASKSVTQKPKTGNRKLRTGHRKPEIQDTKPGTEHPQPKTGHWKPKTGIPALRSSWEGALIALIGFVSILEYFGWVNLSIINWDLLAPVVLLAFGMLIASGAIR